MNLTDQIVAITGCFLLSFAFIRGFLYGLKRYQLNNSAYKKRKKGETLREWLFYSRYKEEIPKILLVFYYFVLIIHSLGLISCSLLHVLGVISIVGRIIMIGIAIFDAVWILMIHFLFWTPNGDYPYERWITKNREQTRKKK